jgi:hypothetical protein
VRRAGCAYVTSCSKHRPCLFRGTDLREAQAQVLVPKLPVLVNGAVGVIVIVDGRPFAVIGFTISAGKIVEIDAILDPDRLAHVNLAAVLD